MNNLQRIALSMGLPILLGLAVMGYIGWRAKAAKAKIDAFCADVKVGATVDGLADRARSASLSVHEFPERDGKGNLLVEDGVLLARHFCSVQYEQHTITGLEKSFVD
jgi:hypothetical protein